MENTISLLKNNTGEQFDELDFIKALYSYLQGEVPDRISLKKGTVPNLTPRQAENVIWYLQEHFSIIPDHYEVCSRCGHYYNSHCEGFHSEYTEKSYCGSCTTLEDERKEERYFKRQRSKKS